MTAVDRHPDHQVGIEGGDPLVLGDEAGLLAEEVEEGVPGGLVGRGDDPSLITRAVGTYKLIAVASPGYVARWGGLREPSDLRYHSCLLFRGMGHRPGHPQRPELPHRHIVCPDEDFAHEGARAGLGIAILRQDVVASDLESGALIAVLEAYNPLKVPVYAVYPERAHLRAAVMHFMEYVESRLRG